MSNNKFQTEFQSYEDLKDFLVILEENSKVLWCTGSKPSVQILSNTARSLQYGFSSSGLTQHTELYKLEEVEVISNKEFIARIKELHPKEKASSKDKSDWYFEGWKDLPPLTREEFQNLKIGDKVVSKYNNGMILTVERASKFEPWRDARKPNEEDWRMGIDCCTEYSFHPDSKLKKEDEYPLKVMVSPFTPKWDLKEPKPIPCPHPEWLGIWDYKGVGYRIRWNGRHCFQARYCLTGSLMDSNWKPEPGWTQIEEAPQESINGGKLSRDQIFKHELKTPWDPELC